MLQFKTSGVVSDGKVNILGIFRLSEKFPAVFKIIVKNNKKSEGKKGIFTQNQFLKKIYFF